MDKKTLKVRYISDKVSIFFEKGKIYDAFIPKDDNSGRFFGFHFEDVDEPGDYALPANRFEVVDEYK